MGNEEIRQLEQEIAWLESVNDLLQTDLDYVDTLLRKSGFPEGIDSIKSAALEMIDDQEINS